MARTRRRLLAAALLAGAILGVAAPARANPVICITMYYRIHNGPPQYVLNNFCQVPTSWDPLITFGPSCLIDTDIIDVCRWMEISLL